MTTLYRLMGAVALLNQRLSRTRINFIPLNWVAMIALGALMAVALDGLHDATVNGAKPRAISVAEVLDHHDMEHNYVTVEGLLVPGDGYTEKEDGSVKNTWVPLVDVKGRRAFLVELNQTANSGKPHSATVTGMLRSMDTDLTSQVQKDGGDIEGIPIDTDYMLVEGQHPGSAAGWGTVSVVTGVFLALFIITFLQRYIVFQRTAPRYAGLSVSTPDTTPSVLQEAVEMRVTGQFTLDAKNSQRFLNVPASIVSLETGEIAFVSNIDASRRFMGVTTAKRTGLWAAVIRNGSLGTPEQGHLYVGFTTRPAARIQYTDGSTNRQASTILSFGSEHQREIVLRDLQAASQRPVGL